MKESIRIILRLSIYEIFWPGLPNQHFQYQECFGFVQVEGVEGVGIKGALRRQPRCSLGALRRQPRCSLLRNSRGASPLGGGAFFTEIIYDDNETINN